MASNARHVPCVRHAARRRELGLGDHARGAACESVVSILEGCYGGVAEAVRAHLRLEGREVARHLCGCGWGLLSFAYTQRCGCVFFSLAAATGSAVLCEQCCCVSTSGTLPTLSVNRGRVIDRFWLCLAIWSSENSLDVISRCVGGLRTASPRVEATKSVEPRRASRPKRCRIRAAAGPPATREV